MQEVTGSSPVPSTKTRASDFGQGLFCCVIHQPTSEQDGTGLEQQRRRPPPAAETGSRGWDSVLIFQSPAKGLRKNQQTQPVQAPAVRFRQGSQRIGMSTKKDAARPKGLGTFFVVDGTGREPEQAKAGYHRGDGILPFAILNRVWYTRLSSTNRDLYIKENIDETVFMFALFKCRKSDKGRN